MKQLSSKVHRHASSGPIDARPLCATICGLACDTVDTAYAHDEDRVTCETCLRGMAGAPITSKPAWADRAHATGVVVWSPETGWTDGLPSADAPEDVMCGCSEDYGPCEDHSTQLAQREGASTRTADSLALVFLMDVRDLLDAHTTETQDAPTRETVYRLTADIDCVLSWTWSRDAGDGWLEDDGEGNYAEILQDMVQSAEGHLSLIDASVWWDDGYRILVMSEDCPIVATYGAPDEDYPTTEREDYETAAREYRP